MTKRTISVSNLARVEGEGALYVKIRDHQVENVILRIFEPPRFFEAFMRGRKFTEAPDITARICGICPVAYQMSAVHAMENALDVTVDGPLRAFRRLLYCGEWIESHVLHIFMLHAPDFLGYEDAIRMAQDHPEIVQSSLSMKKAGNAIVSLLGGREIHPINVKVGGFYRVPARSEFAPLLETLKRERDQARKAVAWTAHLPFPDAEHEYEFVSLSHPDEYPFNEGRVLSSGGLDIRVADYEKHFEEGHVEHSNALHSVLSGRGAYFVGPLARFNLNFDLLSPLAREAATEVGIAGACHNPFRSIIVRAVETLHAFDEAIRILEGEWPDAPAVDVPVRAGTGCALTEAPRGSLYHRYTIDDDGLIREAKIVPPTSQNQKIIENDVRRVVEANLELDKEDLTWRCEQSIRNYDPCISCATHFLELQIEIDRR
jgi:coenzyme F420-reducing hydrogenase alpha subunit